MDPYFIRRFVGYTVVVVPDLEDFAGVSVDVCGPSLLLNRHCLSGVHLIIVKVRCSLRTARPSTLRL
jgi:hypothetical protein